jgi:hypothetical protein
MKTSVQIFLTFYFFTSFLFSQTIQWEQLNGPFSGTPLCFSYNSNGDLFAGMDQNQRGVFKSTDNGITWFPKSDGIPLGDRAISWITVDDSNYVIIGTNSHIGSGVYKSKDNGESWVKIANLGGTSVAVNDSGHIYVGDTGYGQYSVSKDGGYTWTHNPHPSPFIRSIAINDSGHIFVGGNYTAYRSTDNGATWTTLSGGITSEINSIAFNDSGHIFAGNWQEYGSQSGILKSTDNGDTWTTVKLGFRVNSSHNIVINNAGYIFVGSNGWGIWRSTDDGVTWTQQNSGLQHIYIKSMYILNDGNIYAGTVGAGIYRSTDNGESWQQTGVTSAQVKALKVSPANGSLFASVVGMSRSTDSGVTWEPINNGISTRDVVSSEIKNIAIKSDGTIFIGYATNWPTTFIYRSTNNGDSWTLAQSGIQGSEILGLTVDDSDYVYASSDWQGVYKSTDNGDSWFSIGNPSQGGKLALNSIGDLFLASWGAGLWKLPASDTTWVNLTSNIGASWIWTMLIGSNDYIYVGNKRSTDNGTAWEEILQPGPYPCYAENSVGHIFMGTRSYGTGIWRSTDFGESWESINTNLPTLEIWSLAIDSDDYLYAGTDGYSMLKTTTSTVTSVGEDRNIPTSFFLEQNFPNPFNSSTKISWQSPVCSNQTIKLFDLLGREIETIVDGYYDAGYHSALYIANSGLPSGVYFYQLKAGDPANGISFVQTKKMLLIK